MCSQHDWWTTNLYSGAMSVEYSGLEWFVQMFRKMVDWYLSQRWGKMADILVRPYVLPSNKCHLGLLASCNPLVSRRHLSKQSTQRNAISKQILILGNYFKAYPKGPEPWQKIRYLSPALNVDPMTPDGAFTGQWESGKGIWPSARLEKVPPIS